VELRKGETDESLELVRSVNLGGEGGITLKIKRPRLRGFNQVAAVAENKNNGEGMQKK